MSKKSLMVFVLLMMPVMAFAFSGQDEQGGFALHQQNKIARMTQELGLSADQVTQVTAVFNNHHAKMKALHDEKQAQLAGILSPDQFAKYQAMKQKHHHNWRDQHANSVVPQQ